MKFKDLLKVIPIYVYIEVVVMARMTHKEVAGYGFYNDHEYSESLWEKLDHLTVHHVEPKEVGELHVFLLEGKNETV